MKENITGITTVATHNATKVPIHSSAATVWNSHLVIQHMNCVGLGSYFWRNPRHPKTREYLKNSKHTTTKLGYQSSLKKLKGHLCPLPEMRHLGAECPSCTENNHKCLSACWGFLSTNHQSQLCACNCSLAAAPGSRRYSGAQLLIPALTAILRFSSSLWLSSPLDCTSHGQYAHWICFLCFLEIPRSAFPGGLFLSQNFTEAWVQIITCHFFQALCHPLCQDSLLSLLYIPALFIYEDRCACM